MKHLIAPSESFPTKVACIFTGFALKILWDILNKYKPSRDRLRTKKLPVRPAREEYKMVLIVNSQLRMGNGKISAQVAHAAVGMVDVLSKRDSSALEYWRSLGQPKICLRARDSTELLQLARTAQALALPTFVVEDAGRTQVPPGSKTVLAIGPAPRSKIDQVTAHLKLL